MNANARFGISRQATAALLGGACLLGTSGAWRHISPAAAMMAGAPLEQLRRQAETLRAFDDASAAKAVARRDAILGQLWTPAQLSAWKEKVPARWTVQESTPQANKSTLTRRLVLTRQGAPARDWPEIYRFLQELDALPTAVIHGLTLSMPQPQTRQFQTVQIVVDLSFRNESAPPEEGGDSS